MKDESCPIQSKAWKSILWHSKTNHPGPYVWERCLIFGGRVMYWTMLNVPCGCRKEYLYDLIDNF